MSGKEFGALLIESIAEVNEKERLYKIAHPIWSRVEPILEVLGFFALMGVCVGLLFGCSMFFMRLFN